MSECPACAETKRRIEHLREIVWGEDIPHPTVPECREHHKSISRILKFIDDILLAD